MRRVSAARIAGEFVKRLKSFSDGELRFPAGFVRGGPLRRDLDVAAPLAREGLVERYAALALTFSCGRYGRVFGHGARLHPGPAGLKPVEPSEAGKRGFQDDDGVPAA